LVHVCSLLLEGLALHLNITHWLTDWVVAALLNLVFNVVYVFELSSDHLYIIGSTFASRRIIITNLSRSIMLLNTNDVELWCSLTNHSFLLLTNRLSIDITLLFQLTCPNRITLMLFNRSMLTIILCCFTYRIHFPHLYHIVLQLLGQRLLLLLPFTFELLESLGVLLVFVGEASAGFDVLTLHKLHVFLLDGRVLVHLRVTSCHHHLAG
jgi:hypothetical protein